MILFVTKKKYEKDMNNMAILAGNLAGDLAKAKKELEEMKAYLRDEIREQQTEKRREEMENKCTIDVYTHRDNLIKEVNDLKEEKSRINYKYFLIDEYACCKRCKNYSEHEESYRDDHEGWPDDVCPIAFAAEGNGWDEFCCREFDLRIDKEFKEKFPDEANMVEDCWESIKDERIAREEENDICFSI